MDSASSSSCSSNMVHTRLKLQLLWDAGLPPTWARKRDALQVLSRVHEERFGTGFDPAEVPTYRRKFLWHSGWDPDVNRRRPPFYGSFTRTR
jgi:hypothetical protein